MNPSSDPPTRDRSLPSHPLADLGAVDGYHFSEISGCNWLRCWAELREGEGSSPVPYIIQLLDYSLWVVPDHSLRGCWGDVEHFPPVDRTKLIGPFDSFDAAFATFVLMLQPNGN